MITKLDVDKLVEELKKAWGTVCNMHPCINQDRDCAGCFNREVKEIANRCAVKDEQSSGWIPVEEKLPENDKYILLSFTNFTIPVVGRYEENKNGGAFYAGDEDETLVSQDMYVNAWMPLPKQYSRKEICTEEE